MAVLVWRWVTMRKYRWRRELELRRRGWIPAMRALPGGKRGKELTWSPKSKVQGPSLRRLLIQGDLRSSVGRGQETRAQHVRLNPKPAATGWYWVLSTQYPVGANRS